MNQVKELKCGCKIPIVNNRLNIDYNALNDNCQKAWDVYSNGNTRSVFQLESRSTQNWCKILKPSSIKDAADLIAIIRPGIAQAKDETGRSMTEVFCNRKNGIELFDVNNEADKILSKTYCVLIFQESLLKLSKELAGFDGKQATKLMKSVGKKDAELLFSLEKQFVQGCVAVGKITEKEAIDLFANIKASARYLFNACICPTSTFVNTRYAKKSIKDLQIGEFIDSPDGFIEVIDKFCTGIKNVYEIELESGKRIRCTMDHEFLCKDGKKYNLKFILENNLEICEQN